MLPREVIELAIYRNEKRTPFEIATAVTVALEQKGFEIRPQSQPSMTPHEGSGADTKNIQIPGDTNRLEAQTEAYHAIRASAAKTREGKGP